MIKIILALAFAVSTMDANAAAYKVDTKASKVDWKGTKKIGNFHSGKISLKDGQVQTNDKNELVGGNFVIDMTTITNDDLAADPDSQKKLVGHLSSADFFDVKKYPTSIFKITNVTKKTGNDYLLKGDLTIKDKTHSIEFPAEVKPTATGLKGEAKFKIDRTKWDVKFGSGNFFKELTADKIINNEIEFDLDIVANK
jgi:polyisoprenoid-binding protein YceI